MRRGLRLFLTLAAALLGNSGICPGFAVADDASRSKAAPAIGANPSSPESIEAGGAAGSWRLVRTFGLPRRPPRKARRRSCIRRIERSDPRLAGLMLRCGREGVEAVVVVVEPFPPHAARPQITLRTPGQEYQFIGTIISTGAGIRLPGDATSLVTDPWRTPPDLEIKVAAGGAAPNVSKNKTLRDRAFREI